MTLLILSIVEWLWCLIQYKQCHILAIFPNKNGSKSIQYKHCHLLAVLILDFLEWYNSLFSKNNAICWQFYRIGLAVSLFSIKIDISRHCLYQAFEGFEVLFSINDAVYWQCFQMKMVPYQFSINTVICWQCWYYTLLELYKTLFSKNNAKSWQYYRI